MYPIKSFILIRSVAYKVIKNTYKYGALKKKQQLFFILDLLFHTLLDSISKSGC